MDRIEPDHASEEQDPGEQDGAERAFEALREEVAGTKRIDGRVTASQIASASATSFLLRLT